MNNEMKKKANELLKQDVIPSMAGLAPKEIDRRTLEILTLTDELKCEYQFLKGHICEQLKEGCDFETILNTIREIATKSTPEPEEEVEQPSREDRLAPEPMDEAGWVIDERDNIYDPNFKGTVKGLDFEIISTVKLCSETADEALEIAEEELARLRGMKKLLAEYVDSVTHFCSIWLQAVFGVDCDAMALPDSMIGCRLDDGEWSIYHCRQNFAGIMLYLMDEYDVKSVPFRAAGCQVSDIIEQADFVDETVNRKALIDLLQSLYAIDEATLERLQNDNAYFVEVAKYFLDETAKTIAKAPREVFLDAHGIEDGVPKTLMELSDHYGVTRELVRQLLAREARKLKHPLHRERILRLK